MLRYVFAMADSEDDDQDKDEDDESAASGGSPNLQKVLPRQGDPKQPTPQRACRPRLAGSGCGRRHRPDRAQAGIVFE